MNRNKVGREFLLGCEPLQSACCTAVLSDAPTDRGDGADKTRRDSSSNQGELCQIPNRTEDLPR